MVILDCLHRVVILGKVGSILIVLATVQPPSNAILLNAFFPRILHFWYELHCLWDGRRFLLLLDQIKCTHLLLITLGMEIIKKRPDHSNSRKKTEQLLCSVKSLGELLRIEKVNYLSFESWGWHGAHIFASTGLASWMNSEFPQENIFRTESQRRVQCLVCCVFALYVCFVFVLSICNLCFRVVLFCVSFLCFVFVFVLDIYIMFFLGVCALYLYSAFLLVFLLVYVLWLWSVWCICT